MKFHLLLEKLRPIGHAVGGTKRTPEESIPEDEIDPKLLCVACSYPLVGFGKNLLKDFKTKQTNISCPECGHQNDLGDMKGFVTELGRIKNKKLGHTLQPVFSNIYDKEQLEKIKSDKKKYTCCKKKKKKKNDE